MRALGLVALFLALMVTVARAAAISGPAADAIDARPPEAAFASVDEYALSAPPSAMRSVTDLAAYLRAVDASEMDRARAIFRWITGNVRYDVAALRGGSRPDPAPEAVLQSRLAVCQGYANLFDALARAAGLESQVVSGFCRGLGWEVGEPDGPDNHAWNVVRIGGRWGLIDSTWGAGHIGSDGGYHPHFEPFYFLPPPGRLIYSHLPTDPRWQLLAQPLDRTEHAALPCIEAEAWDLGVEPAPDATCRLQTDGSFKLDFRAPDSVVMTALLAAPPRSLPGATFAQVENGASVVHVQVPRPGTYTLFVFAAPRGVRVQPEVMRFRVDATSGAGAGGFPITLASFRTRSATLAEPLAGRLDAGPQRFRVRVPGARQVQVVQGETWTPLAADGDWFEGSVPLTPGRAAVAASFEAPSGHSQSYEVLLQYEVR